MKIIHERPIILTPAIMASRTHREPISRPRSPGIHVQAVNRALGQAAGKLGSDDDLEATFGKLNEHYYSWMLAEGVAFEEMRVSHYSESELIWQPYELERDGIYGTPDGLLCSDLALWECKRTTKKYKAGQKFGCLADCWLYLKQGMSYCAMDSDIRRVQYDVLWALGDYTRPYQPMATTTLIEFSDEECETWWERVKAAAAGVKPE